MKLDKFLKKNVNDVVEKFWRNENITADEIELISDHVEHIAIQHIEKAGCRDVNEFVYLVEQVQNYKNNIPDLEGRKKLALAYLLVGIDYGTCNLKCDVYGYFKSWNIIPFAAVDAKYLQYNEFDELIRRIGSCILSGTGSEPDMLKLFR